MSRYSNTPEWKKKRQQNNSGVGDREDGLSSAEKNLLSEFLQAMNREHPEYSFFNGSMTEIADSYNVDVDQLIEQGYLDSHRILGYLYYTVTRKGRKAISEPLKTGGGQGDVGEKTRHIFGCVLAQRWLEEQPYIDQADLYRELWDEVYDVAGFGEEYSLECVVEVETKSKDRAVLDDFDKMASLDAKAIWLFPTVAEARDKIRELEDAGRVGKPYCDQLWSSDGLVEFSQQSDADGLDVAITYKGVNDLYEYL